MISFIVGSCIFFCIFIDNENKLNKISPGAILANVIFPVLTLIFIIVANVKMNNMPHDENLLSGNCADDITN